MVHGGWKPTEVVAWTERDGPGRPPEHWNRRWTWAAPAVLVSGALVVMLATDSLCPEHRAWVQVLGGLAMVAAIASIICSVRSSTVGPILAVAAGVLGVTVGLIDALHEPVRGGVVAGAFALALLVSTFHLVSALRVRAWDRAVVASASPTRPAEHVTAPTPTATTPERRSPLSSSLRG